MTHIAVFANSGAGKDTLANYLVENYGYKRFHPIADVKIFLEDHFNLKRGQLDCQKGRKQVMTPIDENFKMGWSHLISSKVNYKDYRNLIDNLDSYLKPGMTFIEFLISLHGFTKENCINLSQSYMRDTLEKVNDRYVFIAIRNPHEADLLRGSNCQVVEVVRDNSVKLPPDNLQQVCQEIVLSHSDRSIVRIDNNGSLEEFHHEIDRLMFSLN